MSWTVRGESMFNVLLLLFYVYVCVCVCLFHFFIFGREGLGIKFFFEAVFF